MNTFAKFPLARVLTVSTLVGGLVAAVSGSAIAASTTLPLYGGGSLSGAMAYRDLFNCWGSNAGGSLGLSPGVTCPIGGFNPGDEALYDSSGSNAGQAAYLANNPARLNAPVSDYPPATSSDHPDFPYPQIHFASGDTPLTASQIATLNAAALGPAIQVPVMIMPIAIAFNESGLHIVNRTLAGSSSGLNLSRDNLCGIFSGAINDWSNVAFSADNGLQPLSATPLQIKVVYRHDANDTAQTLSVALIAQCASSVHPMPSAWGAAASDYFLTNAAAGRLPSNFVDDITLDGGSETGAEGMTDAIAATAGAIGYLPPEFAKPFIVSGHVTSPTANLQNQASVTSGVKHFVDPNATTARMMFTDVVAPVAGDDAATWGTKGVATNPGAPNAYPIGGFVWLYLYSCYSDRDVLAALTGPGDQGLLRWLYSFDNAIPEILQRHGISDLPGPWRQAVSKLLFSNAASKIRKGGGANASFCFSGD